MKNKLHNTFCIMPNTYQTCKFFSLKKTPHVLHNLLLNHTLNFNTKNIVCFFEKTTNSCISLYFRGGEKIITPKANAKGRRPLVFVLSNKLFSNKSLYLQALPSKKQIAENSNLYLKIKQKDKNLLNNLNKHFSFFSSLHSKKLKSLNSTNLRESFYENKIKNTKDYTKLFLNCVFDKGRLKIFVIWFLKTYGQNKTIELLDQLKQIGFGYATKAGISLGIDDLKIPPQKTNLLVSAQTKISEGVVQYKRGEITGVERFQGLIDAWHQTSENLKQEVIRHFEATDVLNPVYMMAFSGARGNISQVRQLVGMRGLMADPQGQIIDFPIRSNFREGLTLTEYIISSYGARKGIVDTALRTANAGYLTRRLVDVAQHVIVCELDCKTNRGILIFDMKEGNKTIYSLQNRLVGRVLAKDIFDKQQKIASKNQEVSMELATAITKITKKALVRSPLTCEAKKLVCQLCYGWSLATNTLVSIGEAVGIVAAQSIGEPGTQLTMRTFHTGGVFSGGLSDQIIAPTDGLVEYAAPIPGICVRMPQGQIVFLTKTEGCLIFKNTTNVINEISNDAIKQKNVSIDSQSTTVSNKMWTIPPYTVLFTKNKQKVFKKQLIAQLSSIVSQKAQKGDAEQTIYAEFEGQIYNSYMDVVEKTNEYNDFSAEAWKAGYFWVLAGKIYQYPINSPIFSRPGDFVGKNSILNRFDWVSGDRFFLQTDTLLTQKFSKSKTSSCLSFSYDALMGTQKKMMTSFENKSKAPLKDNNANLFGGVVRKKHKKILNFFSINNNWNTNNKLILNTAKNFSKNIKETLKEGFVVQAAIKTEGNKKKINFLKLKIAERTKICSTRLIRAKFSDKRFNSDFDTHFSSLDNFCTLFSFSSVWKKLNQNSSAFKQKKIITLSKNKTNFAFGRPKGKRRRHVFHKNYKQNQQFFGLDEVFFSFFGKKNDKTKGQKNESYLFKKQDTLNLLNFSYPFHKFLRKRLIKISPKKFSTSTAKIPFTFLWRTNKMEEITRPEAKNNKPVIKKINYINFLQVNKNQKLKNFSNLNYRIPVKYQNKIFIYNRLTFLKRSKLLKTVYPYINRKTIKTKFYFFKKQQNKNQENVKKLSHVNLFHKTGFFLFVSPIKPGSKFYKFFKTSNVLNSMLILNKYENNKKKKTTTACSDFDVCPWSTKGKTRKNHNAKENTEKKQQLSIKNIKNQKTIKFSNLFLTLAQTKATAKKSVNQTKSIKTSINKKYLKQSNFNQIIEKNKNQKRNSINHLVSKNSKKTPYILLKKPVLFLILNNFRYKKLGYDFYYKVNGKFNFQSKTTPAFSIIKKRNKPKITYLQKPLLNFYSKEKDKFFSRFSLQTSKNCNSQLRQNTYNWKPMFNLFLQWFPNNYQTVNNGIFIFSGINVTTPFLFNLKHKKLYSLNKKNKFQKLQTFKLNCYQFKHKSNLYLTTLFENKLKLLPKKLPILNNFFAFGRVSSWPLVLPRENSNQTPKGRRKPQQNENYINYKSKNFIFYVTKKDSAKINSIEHYKFHKKINNLNYYLLNFEFYKKNKQHNKQNVIQKRTPKKIIIQKKNTLKFILPAIKKIAKNSILSNGKLKHEKLTIQAEITKTKNNSFFNNLILKSNFVYKSLPQFMFYKLSKTKTQIVSIKNFKKQFTFDRVFPWSNQRAKEKQQKITTLNKTSFHSKQKNKKNWNFLVSSSPKFKKLISNNKKINIISNPKSKLTVSWNEVFWIPQEDYKILVSNKAFVFKPYYTENTDLSPINTNSLMTISSKPLFYLTNRQGMKKPFYSKLKGLSKTIITKTNLPQKKIPDQNNLNAFVDFYKKYLLSREAQKQKFAFYQSSNQKLKSNNFKQQRILSVTQIYKNLKSNLINFIKTKWYINFRKNKPHVRNLRYLKNEINLKYTNLFHTPDNNQFKFFSKFKRNKEYIQKINLWSTKGKTKNKFASVFSLNNKKNRVDNFSTLLLRRTNKKNKNQKPVAIASQVYHYNNIFSRFILKNNSTDKICFSPHSTLVGANISAFPLVDQRQKQKNKNILQLKLSESNYKKISNTNKNKLCVAQKTKKALWFDQREIRPTASFVQNHLFSDISDNYQMHISIQQGWVYCSLKNRIITKFHQKIVDFGKVVVDDLLLTNNRSYVKNIVLTKKICNKFVVKKFSNNALQNFKGRFYFCNPNSRYGSSILECFRRGDFLTILPRVVSSSLKRMFKDKPTIIKDSFSTTVKHLDNFNDHDFIATNHLNSETKTIERWEDRKQKNGYNKTIQEYFVKRNWKQHYFLGLFIRPMQHKILPNLHFYKTKIYRSNKKLLESNFSLLIYKNFHSTILNKQKCDQRFINSFPGIDIKISSNFKLPQIPTYEMANKFYKANNNLKQFNRSVRIFNHKAKQKKTKSNTSNKLNKFRNLLFKKSRKRQYFEQSYLTLSRINFLPLNLKFSIPSIFHYSFKLPLFNFNSSCFLHSHTNFTDLKNISPTFSSYVLNNLVLKNQQRFFEIKNSKKILIDYATIKNTYFSFSKKHLSKKFTSNIMKTKLFLNSLTFFSFLPCFDFSLSSKMAHLANQRLFASYFMNRIFSQNVNILESFNAFPISKNQFRLNKFNSVSVNQIFAMTSFLSPLQGEMLNKPKNLWSLEANENTCLILTESDLLSFYLPNYFYLINQDVDFSFKQKQNFNNFTFNHSFPSSNQVQKQFKNKFASLYQNFLQLETLLQQKSKNNIFDVANVIIQYNKKFYKIKGLQIGSVQPYQKLRLGSFLVYGDAISTNSAIDHSGQIIHMSCSKITLRAGQPVTVSPKGILHAYHGDFVTKNAAVITLPFQTLKTGDIVQGIPKVEQYFEARTTKRGRLFRDSLPNLLQGLFERYRSILPLEKAVRQSFLKIQQIIVDGVHRVYRSQGVSISDKHLEIVVRQMTTKVQIVHGGQTGFFPGELVDLEFVENINHFLLKKISYEPVVLGITRASLEVDSFLSAASFQQTTKVLSKAAIYRKKDFLKGLKENIIVGNLIPAGTGYLIHLKNFFNLHLSDFKNTSKN